jgi:3-deoxy-D-arabino-heptulosonate 7-phosphate (DAHP) synthase
MEKYLQDLFTNQQYDENNFFLIAGPCVVESEELVMEVADKVAAFVRTWVFLMFSKPLIEKPTAPVAVHLPELATLKRSVY